MNRDQTAHEELIPWLVGLIGARTYLEFGTHANETISKVKCEKRYGVDIAPRPLDGAHLFAMTTAEFLAKHAATYAPYDAVLIDADHAKESVAQDFFGILPHVSPDGLIFLHDTNPETAADTAPGYCNNAWEFARFITDGGYETVTLPYFPGLTIVRKRTHWGPIG